MSYENVEKCISRLKTDPLCQGQKSIMYFDMQKYNLMSKIKDEGFISKEEWELINKKYICYYDFAKVMLESPIIGERTKEQILQSLCEEKIIGCTDKNRYELIRSALCHFPKISNTSIKDLFYNFNSDVANVISSQLSIPSTLIPQDTVDKIAILELNIINEKVIKPLNYERNLDVFSLLLVNDTLKYVMHNMPEDGVMCEKIATSLINARNIHDDNKDRIFNMHGCVAKELIMITPNIANELYLSAIEVAMPETIISPFSEDTILNVLEAKRCIENLRENKLMTEAQECDFVNRIINKDKKERNYDHSEILEVISKSTDSYKVLHIIFTSALNKRNRNEACKNSSISKEDLRTQAKLYCDKIRDKQSVGNTSKMPNEWFEEISNAIKRATLCDEDYETILSTNDSSLMHYIVTSRYTPGHVFKEAKHIINDHAKEEDNKNWKLLKLQVAVNEELLNNEIFSSRSLHFTSRYLVTLALFFDEKQDLSKANVKSIALLSDDKLRELFEEILLEAVDMSEYTPKDRTREEFKAEISFAVTQLNEMLKYGNKKPANLLTTNELEYEKNKLVIHFLDETKDTPEKVYFQIEKMADRYIEITDELNTRQKGYEIDER